MSNAITDLQATQFILTVRFDQGYRYLDRCGEAIIRLESTLDKGWIPGELAPTGGQLNNFTLGMGAVFNTESLTVNQTEFMSFTHFVDQGCKIFEVLRNTLEIKRLVTPVLRVLYQIGFLEADDAESFLRRLSLNRIDPAFLTEFGGQESALDFALVTYDETNWQETPVKRRRRVAANVLRQERQPTFDERVMRRLPLLPERYHDAIRGLREFRRIHSRIAGIALQFDVENSLEAEFNTRTFDLPAFLQSSHAWCEQVAKLIRNRIQEQCQTA